MVVRVQVATGLSALVGRFALWCRVEGKSPRTVEFYEGNLRRFLWYCQKKGFPRQEGGSCRPEKYIGLS